MNVRCHILLGTAAMAFLVGPSPAFEDSKADLVTIIGTAAGRGVVCPLFRLEDGGLVTLSGKVSDLPNKTTMYLTGRWAKVSTCMQGRTLIVESSEEAK